MLLGENGNGKTTLVKLMLAPDPAARPNVKYASARPKDGGLVFALQALEDIPAGAELLANYEDNERVSGMRAWE